ncbi:hypothetical protein FHX63_005503 [Cupriavidus plantarum]|uniref:Uncharacterized protein n=1 Tax=Cupriavidus plantarum TaxID=942865 RepID=A0A316F3F5_9BURK|nr:hypothetical protein [Cupriavidus plantarum]NYI02676.1 hypothetical protein [Cupriavidus plantarum]PWK31001.1 hypothetical protein C7419_11142 [Cupriavidus plantarum]
MTRDMQDILERAVERLRTVGFVIVVLLTLLWSHPRAEFDDDTV